jgi:hypothetical protein
LRANAQNGQAAFSVDSRQVEGLRSETKIRQFSLTIDEPPTLGGSDAGPNPVELVLAALATCQEITYRAYATALGIPLESVSVKLDGALDLDRQAEAFDGEQYLGRQGLIAFQPAAGDGRAYRLLDFALRRDADFFQKLAYTDIESFLVHDRLSKVPERWPLARYSIASIGPERMALPGPSSRWTTPMRSGKFGPFRPAQRQFARPAP